MSAAAIAGGLALAGRLDRAGWGRTVAAAASLGVLGVLLYLPFYIGFQSQAGGILPNLLFPTRLTHYLIVFGPLLVPLLLFLLLLARDLPRRELLERVSSGALWAFVLPVLLVLAVLIAVTLLPSTRDAIQALLASPAFRGAAGAGTPGDLLGIALGVRTATPWTILFVALALGLVYALLRGAAANPRRSPADLIVVVMAALALLLTYAVEFFYLRDNFGTRMNTVFKFYYQAWILMALAAAYGLSRLTSRAAPRSYRIAALIVTEVLVVAALSYPVAAIPSKTDNFVARLESPGVPAQPTLDGLAYLRASNPDDAAAIAWIRGNVPGKATVLEAIGASYTGDSRISMATGNATLMGWDGHEAQWRGKAFGELAGGRPEAIDRIYRAPQPETVLGFMQQWKLDYLLIGDTERRKYGVTDTQLERLDGALELVFEAGGTRIYAR